MSRVILMYSLLALQSNDLQYVPLRFETSTPVPEWDVLNICYTRHIRLLAPASVRDSCCHMMIGLSRLSCSHETYNCCPQAELSFPGPSLLPSGWTLLPKALSVSIVSRLIMSHSWWLRPWPIWLIQVLSLCIKPPPRPFSNYKLIKQTRRSKSLYKKLQLLISLPLGNAF